VIYSLPCSDTGSTFFDLHTETPLRFRYSLCFLKSKGEMAKEGITLRMPKMKTALTPVISAT
jgi:hypothetical protein